MSQSNKHSSALPARPAPKKRICLACGGELPPRHRRYCANACRQNLLATLNRRTGLLRALNARYATFYFTDWVIIMDLLLYDTEQIFSYMMPRSAGRKPVEDFCELSNMLGTLWWNEKNRTKKRYMATQFILDQAKKPADQPKDTVVPAMLAVPAVQSSSLITLELRADELTFANMQKRIKQAYRRQAMKHHPDIGGNTHAFRKIQEAYEKLLEWTKHPTYVRRSGFPDKWLYEGANNRWLQPIVIRTSAK
ncbi:MAG: J domain-containing protein [Desulfobacteraceae bacterium]|nr:J domain-containing protein [Desulfobacteraceae bacterium]